MLLGFGRQKHISDLEEMAKAEATAVAHALDPLKDAFLFTGHFTWMFYLTLVGFCMANALAILKQTPNMNFFHGCALMVLANFGGSTMAAIMCGAPVPFVCNEALVAVCLSVWTVVYLLPSVLNGIFSNNAIGRLFVSCSYEIQRCHVLMNCSSLAAGALNGALAVPSADRVPMIGPLIAGTLGGCGGGFMPLNKGLDPLKDGTNWRMTSGAIASTWIFVSTLYPSTKAAIGLSVAWARFCAVSFFVVVPLLQFATGFAPLGANPLVPTTKAKAA